MTSDYSRTKVLGALTAGLLAFGFSPILVRFAPETPALLLAVMRTSFAVLLLLPYWLIYRDRSAGRGNAGSGHDQKWMLLAGGSLGLHFILWISSLYYTSVASASVLVAIHPVILILVESLMMKRMFRQATWIGVFMAFAGSVFLGVADSNTPQAVPDPLLGNILAFSAAVVFVVYILIGQQLRQRSEWIDYVFPVYGYAAATCIAVALAAGVNFGETNTVGILAALGLAVGPQILGHGSMNYAVKFVSPTLLSTLILTEPVLATIAAYYLFDEFPPLLSIIAMAIILAGVSLTWKRKVRRKTSQAKE